MSNIKQTQPAEPWSNGGYVGRVQARGGIRPASHDVGTMLMLLGIVALCLWGLWRLIHG